MRILTASEIDQALTFPALIDALAEAFAGDFAAPERHHHGIDREDTPGTLLLMPAWTGRRAKDAYLGVKVVSVFPGNGDQGLPSVLGTYLLMDGGTGLPLAALDGTRLTVWRTAAASALAARFLARPDASRMVMVGAGALAPFLIRAHLSQRPVEEVLLWNRSRARADALAEELRAENLPVRATDDLEAAVRGADLVSCATLSQSPLVKGEWLKPGAHLDLVGAFNLAMREADDEALRRSSLYVDTAAARHEGATSPWPCGTAPSCRPMCWATCSISAGRRCRVRWRPSPCSSRWARPSRIWLRRCWYGAGGLTRRRSLMMDSLIKICGLSTPETLDAALDAGADWVGFAHFPRSPRHVDLETGHALSVRARGRARRVVLLVDPGDSVIAAAVAALDPTCCNCTATRHRSAWPPSGSVSDAPS